MACIGSLGEPPLPQCLITLFSTKCHNLTAGGWMLFPSLEDMLVTSTEILAWGINHGQSCHIEAETRKEMSGHEVPYRSLLLIIPLIRK